MWLAAAMCIMMVGPLYAREQGRLKKKIEEGYFRVELKRAHECISVKRQFEDVPKVRIDEEEEKEKKKIDIIKRDDWLKKIDPPRASDGAAAPGNVVKLGIDDEVELEARNGEGWLEVEVMNKGYLHKSLLHVKNEGDTRTKISGKDCIEAVRTTMEKCNVGELIMPTVEMESELNRVSLPGSKSLRPEEAWKMRVKLRYEIVELTKVIGATQELKDKEGSESTKKRAGEEKLTWPAANVITSGIIEWACIDNREEIANQIREACRREAVGQKSSNVIRKGTCTRDNKFPESRQRNVFGTSAPFGDSAVQNEEIYSDVYLSQHDRANIIGSLSWNCRRSEGAEARAIFTFTAESTLRKVAIPFHL